MPIATTRDSVDSIIVGQGLAGTTLAWQLIAAGETVVIIDNGEENSASRVAAGLITPITGRHLTLSPTFIDEFAYASAFFKSIAEPSAPPLLQHHRAHRVLASATEERKWLKRSADPRYQSVLGPPSTEPQVAHSAIQSSFGSFSMPSAQLDTAAYLDQARRALSVIRAAFDWRQDLTVSTTGITALGYRAHRIISCEGIAARRNPYFDWLPFRPIKGQILTLNMNTTCPPLPLPLHRGIWLAPDRGARRVRLGATFERNPDDDQPTQAGRTELEQALQSLVQLPYEVVDHKAAIRPVLGPGTPLMGRHPQQPRLFFLNGLAAKGTLRAPLAAQRLVAHMKADAPLPREQDLAVFAASCRA